MPLFEFDQTAEEFDQDEQNNLNELFPVIEKPMVQAQVTGWDGPVLSKKKGLPQIEYQLTIINDDSYTGRWLTYYAPLTGRGKNFTKKLVQACGVAWTGKGHDPEQLMGKQVWLDLSVQVMDNGRKRTQIEGVRAI